MVSVSQISVDQCSCFLRHLWYLCPQLVVLAMFDSEVPIAEKAATARALLQHLVPDAFAPGKPGGRHFKQITPKLADFIAGRAQAPCLSTFITDRSCLFFHLAGRNPEGWLQRAPEEWPQNSDYTFMSEVARDMLVVNDCVQNIILRPLQTIIAAHGMSME